jgi:hypothetical protein
MRKGWLWIIRDGKISLSFCFTPVATGDFFLEIE